jgi:hypothetical protein
MSFPTLFFPPRYPLGRITVPREGEPCNLVQLTEAQNAPSSVPLWKARANGHNPEKAAPMALRQCCRKKSCVYRSPHRGRTIFGQ